MQKIKNYLIKKDLELSLATINAKLAYDDEAEKNVADL